MRTTSVLAICTALLFGVSAGPANAAPPVIERWTIDEFDYDDWVSEECGFDVWYHAEGHAALRVFERRGAGPLEVFTINTTVTLSSAGGTYKLKDVGADTWVRRPDGTVVVSISGQVPFQFKGVYKFDPDTDEVLHEPQRLTGDEIVKVCEALAP
jgi:hypothetical protein